MKLLLNFSAWIRNIGLICCHSASTIYCVELSLGILDKKFSLWTSWTLERNMENEKLETLSRAEVRFRFKKYRYPAVFCLTKFYLPFYNSHLNRLLISYLNLFLWTVQRKTNYDCRSLKLLERRQQLSNWPIERGIFLR